MNTISHADYCLVGNTGSREDCVTCEAEYQRVHAKYAHDYYRMPRITSDDIEALEGSKRAGLLMMMEGQ